MSAVLRRAEECGTIEARERRTTSVVCTHCGDRFGQPTAKELAHCRRCGNIWPWAKTHMLRTRRSS